MPALEMIGAPLPSSQTGLTIGKVVRVIAAGLAGGFLGEAFLGGLFGNPLTQSILYDPTLQSPLFIEVTTQRNFPISIAGLIVLSVIHAALYTALVPSLPGRTWIGTGLFWGLTIWLMYWVFQEWFIYRTLLREPFILCSLELLFLLIGSCIEGLVIAFLLRRQTEMQYG
jgi:hypothetical protein